MMQDVVRASKMVVDDCEKKKFRILMVRSLSYKEWILIEIDKLLFTDSELSYGEIDGRHTGR